MNSLRTAALIAAVLLLGGCAQRLEVDAPMNVELDVFSGRPNPSWILQPEEAEELVRRLQDLPPADQAPPDPGLGYRGFVLSSPQREIRAYQGILTVTEKGTTRHYADVNRIESWLAEQATGHGHGSLVAGVGRERE